MIHGLEPIEDYRATSIDFVSRFQPHGLSRSSKASRSGSVPCDSRRSLPCDLLGVRRASGSLCPTARQTWFGVASRGRSTWSYLEFLFDEFQVPRISSTPSLASESAVAIGQKAGTIVSDSFCDLGVDFSIALPFAAWDLMSAEPATSATPAPPACPRRGGRYRLCAQSACPASPASHKPQDIQAAAVDRSRPTQGGTGQAHF